MPRWRSGGQTGPVVTMWEAKAADGRGPELAAWALSIAPAGARVYSSVDDRVVVIAAAPWAAPTPPGGLLDRPAHAWDFAELTGDAPGA